MSYLISISTRPKEKVLDPFLGSGSTGIAAVMLDRKFVGYEIEKEYFEIASERISAWLDSKQETKSVREGF